MLDIGWGELLVIGLVALIVVGPKDLPGMFRTVGQFMGKARGMAREFQRSMEAAADESGLKEASNSLKGLDRLNLNSATTSARKFAENSIKSASAAPAAQPHATPGASPDATPPAEPSASEAPPASRTGAP